MKTNLILAIVFLGVLITACSQSKKVTVDNFHIYETPPNGVKVSDNLFCDQTEMNNFGWMEYMFWVETVFGSQSKEYISTLPDTLVWVEAINCYTSFVGHYLRHPGYRDYPVVGISQKQAEAYSKWRSDMVFQVFLAKYGIIEIIYDPNEDNYFTIEKYFNGELSNVISDKTVNYYPEYRLPDLNERLMILAYSDSLDKAYFDRCNSKYCKECEEQFPEMWSNITPCVDDTLKTEPTRHTLMNCSSKKGNPIYNLRGNVAEWTSEKNIAVGGGWKDNRVRILASDSITTTKQNAWTGFRNVCEWKRWKE